MRALILAGVAAVCLAAWGDPPPSTNPTPGAARPNAGKVLQKYDTNQDGVLSDAEKAAARAAGTFKGGKGGKGGKGKKRFDANGDGVISDAERQAGFQAMKTKNPERFKQVDTNGDGTIDASEAQAARNKRGQGQGK